MKNRAGFGNRAISRAATISVICILVLAAVIGVVLYSSSSTTTHSTTKTTSTSSASSTTSTTSSSSMTTTPSLGPSNSSQLVDDSWTAPYDSLDPQYGFLVTDGYFANVFQGLVQYNGTDSNQVVPSIASNWTVSSDFETWTFTIRSGVHFSNGDQVNAYTGWFSFQRGYLLNAPLGTYVSNYPNLLENVSAPCTGTTPTSCGGEEGATYNTTLNQVIWGTRKAVASAFGFPSSDDNQTIPALLSVLDHFNPSNATQLKIMENPNQGVYVENANTLVLHLLEPYSMFLLALPPQWGTFVDPNWIDSPANCRGVTNNTQCVNFSTKGGPGTGPYMYGKIGPADSYVVLNENPNYWATAYNWSNGTPSALCLSGENCQPVLEPPSIATITMIFSPNLQNMTNDFDYNRVQLAYVGITDFDQFLKSYNLTGYGFDQLFRNLDTPLGDYGIGLNGQVFPTNITDFRLAIVHAVNYSALVSQLYMYDGQRIATLFQPPAPPGYGPLDNPGNIKLYSYNLALASMYLNRSGWEGDFYTRTTAAIGSLPSGTLLGNPHGKELPEIPYDFIGPLTSWEETEHNIIASGLSQIGINFTFTPITVSCFYGMGGWPCGPYPPGNYTGFPPLLEFGWLADWPDPVFQLFDPVANPFFPPTAGSNAYIISPSVTNSTLLALLEKIPFETNLTQQQADTATAWAMYSQLAGVIQLPLPENYVFAQPYVQGIVYSPFEFAYYYNMMYYEPA